MTKTGIVSDELCYTWNLAVAIFDLKVM